MSQLSLFDFEDDPIPPLLRTLERYDERSVRSAIDAAQDPAVARRLLDWLVARLKVASEDANFYANDSIQVGLVTVALAEAGFVPMVGALLEFVGESATITDEVIDYAVRRIGAPMVHEVLRLLAENIEDRERLAGAYLLLLRDENWDEDLCIMMREPVFGRLQIELARPYDEDEPNPAFTAADVLARLGDERVYQVVAEHLARPMSAEEHSAWKQFEAEIDQYFERPIGIDDDFDPARDFSHLAPRWQEMFDELGGNSDIGSGPLITKAELRAAIERMAAAVGNSKEDADKVYREMIGEEEAPEPERSYAPPEITMPIKAEPKVGRNDPCPCGSGKKYKKCCGAA
jgi:hypothetical protein